MEGRLWSKPSFVLSSYTGRLEQEDATGRFHASLAFRREIFDRIGGWPLTKRGDFDQQLIARLHAIEAPGAPPIALAYYQMQCREGTAPAEPHPCRERFFDPRCAAKTLPKRSQRGPAFSGSAGASPAQVFTRLFTEFQRKPMPLAERWADGCNLPPTA